MTVQNTANTPGTRYLTRVPDPAARLRLFCFHHAGGSASAFTPLAEALGPDVSVAPVQLPGRENRAREPRITDVEELAEDLDNELGPALDAPHAFYGHSMGAIVAHRLTLLRHARGRRLPERLMVGAYPAPHLPPPTEAVRLLPDDQLADWLIDLGGMSPILRKYPEWLRSATALVRDDLHICHTYRHRDETAPLPCPIDAFTGSADPLMPEAHASEWSRHTTGGFRLHVVPGGHLFATEPRATFPARISATLRATGAGRAHHEEQTTR